MKFLLLLNIFIFKEGDIMLDTRKIKTVVMQYFDKKGKKHVCTGIYDKDSKKTVYANEVLFEAKKQSPRQ